MSFWHKLRPQKRSVNKTPHPKPTASSSSRPALKEVNKNIRTQKQKKTSGLAKVENIIAVASARVVLVNQVLQ